MEGGAPVTLPDLTTLGTLGLGAAVTALAAGWQQVRSFLQSLLGIVMMTSEFRYMGGQAGRVYCRTKLRTMPSAFRTYDGKSEYIRPEAKHGVVFREVLGGRGRLYWRGMVPMWVSNGAEGAAKDRSGATPDAITFRYIRGTIKHDDLALEIAQATEFNRQEIEDRFFVRRLAGRSGKRAFDGNMSKGENALPPSSGGIVGYQTPEEGRLVGWKDQDIGEKKPLTDPLERLALVPEVEDAVAAIKRWYSSKDWYAERQIPWRYGLGLHGVPGTGKSSLVKAIAQHLRIPIYLLDISTMDNEEFHDAYQTALANTPAIVLIEDIDAVFRGRENIVAEKGKGLTFDCLLNVISGVEASDGLLLVVTTNHIEDVDAALGVPQPGSLSSRPGRIDRMVEMPALTAAGRLKLARRILSDCHESWVEHLVALGENDTGAQFEDRCATIALNLFWSKNPKQPAPNHLEAVA